MERSRRELSRMLRDLFSTAEKAEKTFLCSGEFSDLTLSEFKAIDCVGAAESLTMSELARQLGIALGSCTIAAVKLAKKGYIGRLRGEHDRRVVRCGLSEKGARAYAAYRNYHEHMVDELLNLVPKEQESAVIGYLNRIYAYLKVRQPSAGFCDVHQKIERSNAV